MIPLRDDLVDREGRTPQECQNLNCQAEAGDLK